jgi:hypothetical protein
MFHYRDFQKTKQETIYDSIMNFLQHLHRFCMSAPSVAYSASLHSVYNKSRSVSASKWGSQRI